MSFESNNGYEIDIVYDKPYPKAEVYYNDGCTDGSGKIVLTYEDIKKILERMEKTK